MALNDQSAIGLANHFHVKIDTSPFDLGTWQKCEGLDVTWDIADFRAGDQANMRWYFPGNTKYKPIKLLRAANADDSKLVHKWLNTTAWQQDKARGTMAITLFDSFGKVILTWNLRNAMPKAWNIATMDAGASQVAIETLEIDHEGFLEEDQRMLGA